MIGIFGGTFNPIHNGHVQLALEMIEQLKLDHVRMVPCAIPVHRQLPEVVSGLRFEMVQAAVSSYPRIIADDREIVRNGPSYMVETLDSLSRDFDQPLCLILGSDAFCQLDTWKNWQQLFHYAHIAVLRRPDMPTENLVLSEALKKFLKGRVIDDVEALGKVDSGRVIFMSNRRLSISSSAIRDKISSGEDVELLVPESVYRIIRRHSLYKVKSTVARLSVEKA
jgi:nicotinate-nucleotide adenylyltransferase